ncbi:MAG TPA: ATP-binding protein [Rhodocyclaceae bacterium]|nr:ATP-binding protein [Rhodocyclaceae bacterium]
MSPISQMFRFLMPLQRWLVFIGAYVALDWVSYLHPLHGLNITPWNPSVALGLVCALRYGRITVVPWSLSILLGEWAIRGMTASPLFMIAISLGMGLGYGLLSEALRRNLTTGEVFKQQRSLFVWLMVVLIGTAATSFLYISLLRLADLIPVGDGMTALVRFWVGDFVGIVVTMPFFWMLINHPRSLQATLLCRETFGYGALAGLMLWVVFRLGATAEFQYFYLLFLPLIWAAARQGIAGAAVAAFVLQAGIIAAVHWLNLVAVTVLELQMLGAVLAFVGLFLGVVIDEKQRVSAELRQSLRLAAAGEMAGALAHELNQPLTALSAYGAACEHLLQRGETGERLSGAIRGMVSESIRAADVVRRLRDFFRTGATRLEPISLPDLISSAVQPFADKAGAVGVELGVAALPDSQLLIDRLQLEVVLRNLLANAFDAVTARHDGQRSVWVSAQASRPGNVDIRVEDSGPGIDQDQAAKLFEAFHSSKANGLGLGLAISRAIAEAHGGSLEIEPGSRGAFVLTLPTEEGMNDEK